MKITRVDGLLMSCPFEPHIELPFYNGHRTIMKRDAMLIRVQTDAGITGYGPGPAHERAAAEIRDLIGPFLEGRDPADWASFVFEAPLEVMLTYRAVEVAVLDAAAKAEGVPLSEIAGGRKRDRIKLYGSAGMYQPPEAYAEEAAAIQAAGFVAYKMRPAAGPAGDLETLRQMRAATGPDFGLMLDCHAWWRMGDKSYGLDATVSLAKQMEQYAPTWIEEPLPPDDHPAYVELRKAQPLPVASGEHEPSEERFLDLISCGGVDYVQMDVCCQGGFEMGKRVFAAAQQAGIRFAFHSWGTLLEVIAAAHLGICWDESVVEWLEYPCHSNEGRPGMYAFPVADEILKEPLDVAKDGYLEVPKGPGLGVEVNESIVERYPFIPGPWSVFEVFSPAEKRAVTGDHHVKWVDVPETA